MDHSRGGADDVSIAARSSLFDSLKGCGLSGIRIDKHELKTKLMMPQYLRLALRDSIRFKDPAAGASATAPPENVAPPPPEAPLVVFINPRSGGRHGQKLKQRLQQLISEEQVPPQNAVSTFYEKSPGIPYFFFFSCVFCMCHLSNIISYDLISLFSFQKRIRT